MNDPLGWLDGELDKLDQQGLRRVLQTRHAPQGALVKIGTKSLINFSANDYLGLAQECLVTAVRDSLSEAGWGAGASPLVSGRGRWHAELERRLAAFEATEAALLFPTGYAANIGAIASLVGKPDTIFSDAKNHASIIDGCRLSRAHVQIYHHSDVSHLVELLRGSSRFRRRLIVTDSVFSMGGDLAPLAELAELASRFGAMLVVDEAHGTGVFGHLGRGVSELLGVEDGVHVRVGTMSKALGSLGGFVVGSASLIDWISNRARTYIFSTAAPEALAAAGCRALELVADQPERRVQLLARSEQLRDALRRQDWNLGNSASQIIPVILGDPRCTMKAATALRNKGLLVPGIRPPSVPVGESLLRIGLSYAHTSDMIEQLVAALGALETDG
jgi:8-amino-7-oxononanoate synthase